jgi:hypothetical protein
VRATAADTFTLRGGGQISVASLGAGNAGTLTVAARHLTLRDGSGISAQSAFTTGGNLGVNADYLKLFDGSQISSSVAGDEFSDGGNVTLNSINIVALQGSQITARANRGRGGNILVNAQVFLHDAADVDDVLNASSQVAGNDGTIQNNAPNIDLSGILVALDPSYLDAAARLSQRCGGEAPEARSRFLVQGRGALPRTPGEPWPADVGRCLPSARAEPPPAPEVRVRAPVAPVPAFGFNNR